MTRAYIYMQPLVDAGGVGHPLRGGWQRLRA